MTNPNSAPSYDEMIAQAEAAIASLRGAYREQLTEDVAALADIWSRLDPNAPDATLDEVHALAHNIKGQGGSFGYDLVTSIGASLCDYLRSGHRVSAKERDIVHAHLRLLKLVSDNDIAGTGGEMGQRVVEKLRTLTS
ncbi:Hpt domain-containing protein [Parvibaculum sp.]|uniref:Hpt domain-containing protein n=1 Tax=Parvibaculum sp. TaxID=2024848 RepID=UPI0032114392